MPHTVHHPIFARCYGVFSRFMEHDIGARRDELLSGVSGRVLEVGAGNGMNFRHYPAGPLEVVAVEPEAYLRHLAERAAAGAPVTVSVRDGMAEELPLPDGHFDVAIMSLVLCTIADPAAAMAELRRVLKPGGQLRFLEHVRAEHPRKAQVQVTADRLQVWPWLAGGCHCSRDTVATIERAGFRIDGVERFELGPGWMLTNPVVLGAATSPG